VVRRDTEFDRTCPLIKMVGPPLRDSAGLSPDFVSVPRTHHSPTGRLATPSLTYVRHPLCRMAS